MIKSLSYTNTESLALFAYVIMEKKSVTEANLKQAFQEAYFLTDQERAGREWINKEWQTSNTGRGTQKRENDLIGWKCSKQSTVKGGIPVANSRTNSVEGPGKTDVAFRQKNKTKNPYTDLFVGHNSKELY